MRLCAGHPCTSCLNPHQQPICASAPVTPAPRASILINNRYAPLRRSTCTSCLNPHQQPDMRLCAGQPAPRASILINNRYALLRRSSLHLVPQSSQQPICASAPVNLHLVPQSSQQPICASAPVKPAPRASILSTTDMRLCAGQACTSCLNPLNNRYAPLRRSSLHLVPQSSQQPICASAPVTLHLVPQSSSTTDMRLCAGHPAPRASTMYDTVKHQLINPRPGCGRLGSDSEAERGENGMAARILKDGGGPSLRGRAAIKRSIRECKVWLPFQR